MARRLEALSGRPNAYNSSRIVASLRSRLEREQEGEERMALQREIPKHLLNAGRPEEALQELERLEQLEGESNRDYSFLRAICYLRIGEQANCLMHHSVDSCLLPIRKGGVHQESAGSRAAAGELRKILEADPENLSARWLLNLAYMTLGDYPDKVPAQWLIAEEAFESDAELPRFVDVASVMGVGVNEIAGGVVWDDFDGDNLLDLMVSSYGLTDPLRVFRNSGDGTFEERTETAGIEGLWGGLNLVQADYNNDGAVDVLVLRGGWFGQHGRHPNSLLRNDGHGNFADVTEEAGLAGNFPTQTATWLDYDEDGWVDLFIGNESDAAARHRCELYRNRGDGTFEEVSRETGVRHYGFVKAVASGDYNNDGRPDLYLSCLGESNILYRNEGLGADGVWRFADVTREAGVAGPDHSFPTWFFDYNNDGWEDIFVAGYETAPVGNVVAEYMGLPPGAEPSVLYKNNGDGTFTDVAREVGLEKVLQAMGVNYGDLDSDGWLDFYVGTGDPDMSTLIPNRMFRNAEGRRFQDVTTAGGFGHLQKGHGIAFGDMDNDGDQDVYAVMGGAYSGDTYPNVLFANPGHGNDWVVLKLEGVEAARSAIGARIRVAVASEKGSWIIHRTVRSGGSFGASPLRQEIGLGKADGIEWVEVDWPGSGNRQRFEGLRKNACWEIREGVGEGKRVDPPKFELRLTGS